jgi:hypothetical protein
MENWKEIYLELADKLSAIDSIEWVDLWHNQVNFLEDEHPFPAPALFLSFRSRQINDSHKDVQQMEVQVDVYLFYETFADTNQGSFNQGDAVDFMDSLSQVNKLLHGSDGDTYSEMSRISIAPIDTGSAQNLYRQSFTCLLVDESAYSGAEDIVDEQGQPVSETKFDGYDMG